MSAALWSGAEHVAPLVESIWNTLLGLEAWATLEQESVPVAGEWLTGSIHITGACSVVVLLQCPESLARRAAGVVFAQPPEAMSQADVEDTLRELTNVIGGHIKALLPGVNLLSLPEVQASASEETTCPEALCLCRRTFVCGSLPFWVKVLG